MIKIKQGESIFYNFNEADNTQSLLDYDGFYEIQDKNTREVIIDGTLSKSEDNTQLQLRISYQDTSTIEVSSSYILVVWVQNSVNGYKDYILIEDLNITAVY
jgi:hypothetical protein